MKKQYYLMLITAIVTAFVIFLIVGRTAGDSNHPTLNYSAKMPDEYLKNVKYYEDQERHEMSAYNLEKAISSIWKLEKDVDTKSFEMLENAIEKLEVIHQSIIKEQVDKKEMKAAFEYALNNLAHAELEISEMYAETNHMDKSKVALKYAQLHIKNAMLFHGSFWNNDSTQLAIEKSVFLQMDSLINNESHSPMKYTLEIDKMIKEVDKLLYTK